MGLDISRIARYSFIVLHALHDFRKGGKQASMARTNIAFENLRAEMARNNIAIKDMAEAAGVTRDTMSNKLSRKTPINLNEAFLIVTRCFPGSDIWVLFKELADDTQTSRA